MFSTILLLSITLRFKHVHHMASMESIGSLWANFKLQGQFGASSVHEQLGPNVQFGKEGQV
jgi:hypothetical protein